MNTGRLIELPPDIDLDGEIYPGVMNRTIVISDNLPALRAMPDNCVDLIYLDPPFNTGAEYLNPIGLSDAEARGLLHDVIMPAPSVDKPHQTGFSDIFHMGEFNRDGTPNDNWKPGWVREISQAIPSIPGIVEAAGASHSGSMQGYVTFMAIRLIEMQRILKPSGSIYLHCDDTSVHYLKQTMDAVFGEWNYLNNIIWRRATSHNDSRRFGRIVDHLLFYGNGLNHIWNEEAILEMKSDQEIKKAFPSMDERGRYRSENMTGPLHNAPRGTPSTEPWHGYDVHAMGRVWSVPLTGAYADWIDGNIIPGYKAMKSIRARLDALDAARMIHHPKRGKWPGLKRYAAADRGTPQQNLFLTPLGFTNYNKKATDYPTEKPVKLLERIIGASSNPGDVVLDPFCGCATTPIAAEGLNRRWIGIDRGVEAYRQVVRRMRKTFPDMATEGESALIENRRFYRVDSLPGQDNDAPYIVESAPREPPKPRVTLDTQERRMLLGLQEGFCLGCGNKPDIELMEVDHVVPRIQSGPDETENYQLLCAYCNRTKGGSKTMSELWDANERKGLLLNRRRMERLFHERDQERIQSEQMTALREWWK